jgi:predicted SprT family Zn-dependent metalloprotease
VKKNILIISPVYPSKDGIKGETHVVHYFAKEWKKLGYNIVVINSQAVYSSVLYKLPGFIYKYTQKIFGLRKIDKVYRGYRCNNCKYNKRL